MATPAFKVGVWETATVTGTGTITLSGTAKSGPYQNFSGIASGSLVPYRIQDNTTNAWEVGLGTYTVTTSPAGTLTRGAIESSNGGAAVSFAGNSCDVTLEIISPVLTGGSSTQAGMIPALNAGGVLDGSFLANALSSSYLTPINNTGVSSDLPLGVGQSAFITFSSATSVPLRIACADGQIYKMFLKIPSNFGNITSVKLEPNNTTYSGAFAGADLYYYGGSGSDYSNSLSAFQLVLADQIFSETTISTATGAKALVVSAAEIGSGEIGESLWNDSSTVWSSLGTLIFNAAVTGVVVIERCPP